MTDLAESARLTKLHLYLWRPLIRFTAAVFLWLAGTIRTRGKYRIPRKGGVLILANHMSDVDPIVIQLACPRPIHFMAKSELFDIPIIGRLLRELGNFPVKRGEPDRAALKLCSQLLKDGEAVGVFPEGGLSETGELQPLKSGIALIVRLAPGIPVICCGVQNSNLIIPYGRVTPRLACKAIQVNWGEPRVFEKSATTEDILTWATSQLRELT